jgi:predicted PilT family ATPase
MEPNLEAIMGDERVTVRVPIDQLTPLRNEGESHRSISDKIRDAIDLYLSVKTENKVLVSLPRKDLRELESMVGDHIISIEDGIRTAVRRYIEETHEKSGTSHYVEPFKCKHGAIWPPSGILTCCGLPPTKDHEA